MTATVVVSVLLGGNSLYATCATLRPANSISWSRVYPSVLKNSSSTCAASFWSKNFIVEKKKSTEKGKKQTQSVTKKV